MHKKNGEPATNANQAKNTKKQRSKTSAGKDKAKAKKRETSKKEKLFRTVLTFGFLFFTVWLLSPVLYRIQHAGMLFAIISFAGFLLSALPALYDIVFKKSRVLSRIITSLIIIGCTVLLVLLSLLAYGGSRETKPGATVIVLGCAVNGSNPSHMLWRRIYVAYDYALQNPDSRIVACGGQGPNEYLSEGQCIKNTLVGLGIASDRIYVEDKSTSTQENIMYAAGIIEREGLGTNVVIATSRFHQYRASLIAKENGLDASPLSSGTLFWLAPGYWLREIIGLMRWFLLGY